jgi:hypothetical protein
MFCGGLMAPLQGFKDWAWGLNHRRRIEEGGAMHGKEFTIASTNDVAPCNGAAARYHRQWTQTGLTPGFTSTLLLNAHS